MLKPLRKCLVPNVICREETWIGGMTKVYVLQEFTHCHKFALSDQLSDSEISVTRMSVLLWPESRKDELPEVKVVCSIVRWYWDNYGPNQIPCIYWSFSLESPPFSSLLLYCFSSSFRLSLSRLKSYLFFWSWNELKSASVWLVLLEALYKYINTILFNYSVYDGWYLVWALFLIMPS